MRATPGRHGVAAGLVVALGLAGVLVTACASTAVGGDDAAAPMVAVDPYADFAPCDPLPVPSPFEPVEGLVAPDGMVVLEVRRTGPVTAVTGLIDRTPLQLRDAFADREDVEVLHVEDEGFEAEVLLDGGEHRTFLKATIRCRTGSVIALVVARDVDDLPRPGQAG